LKLLHQGVDIYSATSNLTADPSAYNESLVKKTKKKSLKGGEITVLGVLTAVGIGILLAPLVISTVTGVYTELKYFLNKPSTYRANKILTKLLKKLQENQEFILNTILVLNGLPPVAFNVQKRDFLERNVQTSIDNTKVVAYDRLPDLKQRAENGEDISVELAVIERDLNSEIRKLEQTLKLAEE
jgi:hypothetical protein